MEQLFPVVFVTGLIIFIMMRQIGYITSNLDQKGNTNSLDKYSQFSVAIQNHIRAIKLDIDSTKQIENPRYILLDKNNEESSIEILSDFLRKLVFFETLLAKKKKTSEIESELFLILKKLDELIKQNCEKGESLADELRDNLLLQYKG
ncbi:MAG: hypothetical protein JJV95_03155 [Sulfurospirillum sp.]|nr:hypothetical protein [Sulfurospirillum sp.]MBL0702966.1 hypothetical protein [Sulfurospirillum sp.]